MGIILLWIILVILVGILGSRRKIGSGLALLWAILLTPVIGLIIVLLSPSLIEEEYKEKISEQAKNQTKVFKDIETLKEINNISAIQQLKDAKSLLDSGILTQDEFCVLKNTIFSSQNIVAELNSKRRLISTENKKYGLDKPMPNSRNLMIVIISLIFIIVVSFAVIIANR